MTITLSWIATLVIGIVFLTTGEDSGESGDYPPVVVACIVAFLVATVVVPIVALTGLRLVTVASIVGSLLGLVPSFWDLRYYDYGVQSLLLIGGLTLVSIAVHIASRLAPNHSSDGE